MSEEIAQAAADLAYAAQLRAALAVALGQIDAEHDLTKALLIKMRRYFVSHGLLTIAVQIGIVYPVTCPSCLGTGRDIREMLGRIVRDAWIAWAKEQPETKDSWFSPWEELGEPFKEADRRIGMAVLDFFHTMAQEDSPDA